MYSFISITCDRANIGHPIRESALSLFHSVSKVGKIHPRMRQAYAAACLYAACREHGSARTFQEIASLAECSKKDVGRSFKLILRQLGTSLAPIAATDFIARFGIELRMAPWVRATATHISRAAKDFDFADRSSPLSVIGVSLYMASQMSARKLTVTEVAKTVGVAASTLHALHRKMAPSAKDLFPMHFHFK